MKTPAIPKLKVVKDAGKRGIELRGDTRLLISAPEHEVILSGPADTGKSVGCCVKAHLICLRCPGAQGAIMRKVKASLRETVLNTFDRITKNQGIKIMGGANPSRYVYPNGSTIWLGGFDNPEKALSSERDFVYVCQAEEIALNDWEIAATRCSGRGAVSEVPQLFGDCNPGGSRHWIRERAKAGKLRLLVTTHKDNPTLYHPNGKMIDTPEVHRRLGVLENLTGVRRARLLEGKWATAEGAVYDMFDVNVHAIKRDWREMKRWFLAMDEGYTNPAVILLIGEDSDGRHHCFREFYKSNMLQSEVVAFAKVWFNDVIGAATGHYLENEDKTRGEWVQAKHSNPKKRADALACDEAAAGLIADFNDVGINAYPAKGRVLDGINRFQNRLKKQRDGKPRFTIDPSCIFFINELESYVWKPEKDVPEKENDHACDGYRYLLDYLNEPTGAFESSSELIMPQIPQIVENASIEIEQVDIEDISIE